MLRFVSTKGGGGAVDFETAILNGYAPDGGLYVAEKLPKVSLDDLSRWQNLSYQDLAFEILSLFIDREIIGASDLKAIINISYADFEKEDIIPLYRLESRTDTYIMELFHGPTISFKDVGMAFMVNLVDFFLKKRNDFQSIIVATTGDTGPAAAHFIAGKSSMDAWVLYPEGMVTREQEEQMTSLPHENVHPVSVGNCPEGGDDLDAVINLLYANQSFKRKLNLSSVNSLNWGRVMMQTVHYFYGYLRIVDEIGELINVSVPSGGFGNLCAGGLGRKMGLPIHKFVIANNKNACLHRIFSQGLFCKEPIHETISSAIDILVPINFWRYLYYCVDASDRNMKDWIDEFEDSGKLQFDKQTFERYKEGFHSHSINDEKTLETINELFKEEEYLLDPHAAVALAGSDLLKEEMGEYKLICLATAHPAKFPNTILNAIESTSLPKAAKHNSIEAARLKIQKKHSLTHKNLENDLLEVMESNWDLKQSNSN